ncbi:FadR/GntR family transcriptional regulator [Alistipes sp.]|uniref:FadR/GntR family transcriptional regulator n=1 Tax=Alistipes sp. TaxID=1872444 RepID=UPI003AF08D1A
MLGTLKINKPQTTLVDQVEESLIDYFKEQGLRPGSSIPPEAELASALGVARTVLREALSRFKMTGMIESRTKRGMILSEPSILRGMKRCVNPLLMNRETVFDLLEFRIALEIGISGYIFANITADDIGELEQIVEMEELIGDNRYTPMSEVHFHAKLYEITGNAIVSEFQEVIHPVMDFVKDNFRDFFEPIQRELAQKGELTTHKRLLELVRSGDEEGYRRAIADHLQLYTIYLNKNRKPRK